MSTSVCLVTGASSGIGLAVSEVLITNGIPVIGVGRRTAVLRSLERRWVGKFVGVTHELSQPGLMEKVDTLPIGFRAFDTFIHAAGCARQGDSLDGMTDADIAAQIDSNVLGLAFPLRDVVARFRRRGGGQIVVVSSIASVDSAPQMAVYAATKAFASHLVRSLRADLLGSGIRVTCIEPGTTGTPFLDPQTHQGPSDRYTGFQPLEASDIADQILWLTMLPEHVNVQDVRVVPTAQAMGDRAVHRNGLSAAACEEVAIALGTDEFEERDVNGGLFNTVRQLTGNGRTLYFKQFTAEAKSGNFPPLPTTPAQRWSVARRSHLHAIATARAAEGVVAIPELVAANEDDHYMVMTAVDGSPLFDRLTTSGADTEAIWAGVQVMRWLSTMHSTVPSDRAVIDADSRAHKEYKVRLQYENLFSELDPELRRPAATFIEQYLQDHSTLVHGDLNSRNILVTAEAGTAVIDFEQAHLGSGAYDVAYLVSEYVIAQLWRETDPEQTIEMLWASYDADDTASRESRCDYRVHLAFQTLYRLVGPSSAVWTGHLAPEHTAAIRNWSQTELWQWLG
jgi:NADP-dependent 3-hydroxy acid dehydrogenase YdfG/tRNA A-37 threonylcarbamoyl transferase component Bud32